MASLVSEDLEAAWQQLADDTSSESWLTAHYESERIVLKERGVGGRTECLVSIGESEEVIFGGFRVDGAKLVFFQYKGPHVDVALPADARFHVDSLDDLSEAAIAKELGGGASHVILLFTSVPASSVIEGNQNFIRNCFNGRKIPFVQVDGMDMSRKDERNALFAISNMRGKYPQVFVKIDGAISFIGDFDTINELNDCDQLPPDVLEANPQIPTLSKTFSAFIQ